MATFSYVGRDSRGGRIEGRIDGSSKAMVSDQLYNQGVTPLEVVEVGGDDISFDKLFAPKIRDVDIMLFSRQMSSLQRVGVPIIKGLSGLEQSTPNTAMREILRDIRESLDGGRDLATSFARHQKIFGPLYINMIRIGELTGNLDAIFHRLYEYLEFDRFVREQIRSALKYPIFVLVAMLIAILVVNIYVIPQFASVYSKFKADLPFLTVVLIGMSNFIREQLVLILVGLFASAYAFSYYIRTPQGGVWWGRFKIRLPIFGSIVQKGTLARFARSFSLTISSGVPIVTAMNVIAQVIENPFYAQRIEQMRDGLEHGETLTRAAMSSGIFTPMVIQMIAVGEEGGEVDTLLAEVAQMYEREVQYEIKNLAQNIEPILIGVLAAFVLILALGIFLPMWDLGKVVLHQH